MTPKTPVQMPPSIESLLAGYVQKRTLAEAEGFSRGEGLEVTPYEAGPVQPIEPKIAWDEASAALSYFGLDSAERQAVKAPSGWAGLVAQTEPQVAIAFCLGNYPQLVRDFHRLLGATDLKSLRPVLAATDRPIEPASLSAWVEQSNEFPRTLVAAAVCRLVGRPDAADRWDKASIPAAWRAVWDNERAARAWHRGEWDEAASLWKSQTPTLPVRFNRAMAALFSGDSSAARGDFEVIVEELPERSAWHHLARLYHTLSVLRG